MAAEVEPEWGERATPENWMYRPSGRWTYNQVKDLELPLDWELLDGNIVVRGMAVWWHNRVRNQLYYQLQSARREPFAVDSEQCTVIDDRNAPKPDVMVFDKTGLDIRTVEQIPVEKVVLAVEVVSEGSRLADRFTKPALYAQARIPHYWRIERDEDDLPVVHEFWLHHETGVYAPSPERPVHTGKLVTNVPFPVDIDLRTLTEA
ncbi:Uma2 family endonuclease [Streptomyces rimosus]|uniref:Uma2 family endonuclease n=1 Tax=Streptomyces rimosus TaxID=1927 RepID=UPI0004C6ADBC|nr:Uma2 family endonuclease [Streptomyces rimosus]